MGLMAGYGVQLWPILQDSGHQLPRDLRHARRHVPLQRRPGAGVQRQRYRHGQIWVSRALGEMTETYETDSRGQTRHQSWRTPRSTNTGTARHLVRRALLTPDEVRRLPPDGQILFKASAPPIFARKLRYYADPEFRGLVNAATDASGRGGRPESHQGLSTRNDWPRYRDRRAGHLYNNASGGFIREALRSMIERGYRDGRPAPNKSDVDGLSVDIDPAAAFDLFDLVGVKNLLARTRLGRAVDVVSRRRFRPRIRDSILAQAETVF